MGQFSCVLQIAVADGYLDYCNRWYCNDDTRLLEPRQTRISRETHNFFLKKELLFLEPQAIMFALIAQFTQLSDAGYIQYGSGDYDGQGSGSDFWGTVWEPPFGWVNNADGGRSHSYTDYRQQ